MSAAVPPQPPQIPGQVPFKSGQYEFSDEHNRTLSGLSDSLRAFANLMKILGAVVGVLLLVALVLAWLKQQPSGEKPGQLHLGSWSVVIGLLPLTVLFLTFGFWAGKAAGSFRKIAESKNEDVWNLMNALGSLKNMFAMLRFLMLATLVLLVVGAIVAGVGHFIYDPK
ncbi:MAG: hypothetical protein MUF18_19645 [Fimbriiglobus sp.]|jgi:flagellar biosynthesis protein FlhB|nr:hypothetical protein [Fimbriiglobus sp.]